jgi:hypothetical protein
MRLRYYFPLSVGVFISVALAAHHFAAPFAPFAALLIVGETLLGFQLEDHKVTRLLGGLLRSFRSPAH